MNFLDFSFGSSKFIVKKLSRNDGRPVVYLTFDDGPYEIYTEKLLDKLQVLKIKATFFVVGKKAQAQKNLIRRILSEGHTVGDHSWNHEFSYYFSGQKKIRDWVLQSWENLTDILGQTPVGFRSPAGVVTPPLVHALVELKIPLILWSQRFFDTRFDIAKINSPAKRIFKNGEIVLLHDVNARDRFESLEAFLEKYNDEIKKLGFECAAIQDYQLKQR